MLTGGIFIQHISSNNFFFSKQKLEPKDNVQKKMIVYGDGSNTIQTWKEVKTCLLLETPEAANLLEQIVEIPGIDMIHIGLNDMHLALGLKFM